MARVTAVLCHQAGQVQLLPEKAGLFDGDLVRTGLIIYRQFQRAGDGEIERLMPPAAPNRRPNQRLPTSSDARLARAPHQNADPNLCRPPANDPAAGGGSRYWRCQTG